MRYTEERTGRRYRAETVEDVVWLADGGHFTPGGVSLDPVIFVDICRRLVALEQR